MKQFGKLLWSLIEKIALWCLKILFKIIHKELTPEIEEGFLQFVKFGLVGVTNTVISYVIYVCVILILTPAHVSWDIYVGNIVSFILSVLWSFYWNNRFVFAKKDGESRNLWKALIKTYASYSFSGLILANILSWVWVDLLGISKFLAPIINLLVTIPLNFIMNKFWAFKTEKSEEN